MLREWMDNNLPVLVERLVREEIERVARGALTWRSRQRGVGPAKGLPATVALSIWRLGRPAQLTWPDPIRFTACQRERWEMPGNLLHARKDL